MGLSAPAHAIPLTLDGGWTQFTFEDVGSPWSDDFTFELLDPAYFAVTDAFLSGDRFEFFVNGISVGQTSDPTTEGVQINGDFDAAFADPQWSSAQILLDVGVYTITGLTTQSPFSSGAAAVQLTTADLGGPEFEAEVPLPAAGLALLAGLAGLGVVGRRKA